MNTQTKTTQHTPTIFAVIFTVGTIILGYLYYKETQKNHEEKIKAYVKATPIELNLQQRLAINFTERWLSAPMVYDLDEVFYGIQSFNTKISLTDDLKKVISEDKLRNRLELILRRNGISINPESYYTLIFHVDGFWDSNEVSLTYKYGLNLLEDVIISRGNDLRKHPTYTWDTGSFGYVSKSIVEKKMLENVEVVAESFSNRYLKTMDKETRKAELNATNKRNKAKLQSH